MRDVSGLKAEIQRIAWTTDPDERDRLKILKRRLFRLCSGDMANWSHIRGEFDTHLEADDADDLAPYHSIADSIATEDRF
jgi:hypothetical protein